MQVKMHIDKQKYRAKKNDLRSFKYLLNEK
jgi:hypothetical protein